MNKEECMMALEQIILELPQYRKITNNLCNRYISNYVREEYEQEPIYIEGNHHSYRDYCWDIYDTVPISIIEAILDNFKQQEDTEKENINLKQALNEIREYANSDKLLKRFSEPRINAKGETHFDLIRNDILQIIDKVLGDERNGI